MLRERIVWVVALALVAGAGFYTGRTVGITAGEQNRAQAAQQFFGQRGGQGGQGGQGGFRGGQGGGMAGTVSEVSGNTITITTRNGQSVKVQLAADGAVRKQVDGQLSDIKAGEQIVALGAQSGEIFQATSIQIGAGQGGPRAQSP
jgi:preprotein translocase subunit YajC